MRRLEVALGDQSYPIYIGAKLLARLPELLAEQQLLTDRRLLVVTDTHVEHHYAKFVLEVLRQADYQVGLAVVPAGERSKNLYELEQLVGLCLEEGLDRRSVILALGGGVVGDLAGFLAASFMRGIPFVQIPTTLLAHDSSVGGKVGVNHPRVKNYIGAFHQPEMVVFDVETLSTLPQREVQSGFAEVVKHGLIWDASFVEWLAANAVVLRQLRTNEMIEAIYRGCQVKTAVVSQDEREQGIRAILNYGHTIGHALEAISRYQKYTHGEAIAIGMAGAVRLSQKRLNLPLELIERTESLLTAFGLPIRIDEEWSDDEIIATMHRDKKAKNGKISFVITTGLGQVRLIEGITEVELKNTLAELRG